jgi:hypothetical protein
MSPSLPALPSLSSFETQLANFQSGLQSSGTSLGSLITPVSMTTQQAQQQAQAVQQLAAQNPVSTATGTSASGSSILGLSLSRIVTAILGLMAIGGAIYLFKSPSIIGTVKSAAKGALLA